MKPNESVRLYRFVKDMCGVKSNLLEFMNCKEFPINHIHTHINRHAFLFFRNTVYKFSNQKNENQSTSIKSIFVNTNRT